MRVIKSACYLCEWHFVKRLNAKIFSSLKFPFRNRISNRFKAKTDTGKYSNEENSASRYSY